jgi:pimeloyl-ACP methyl ester carboxylesterase
MFIHGGFWRAEYDREHVGPLATDLAGRGYPVATIEYRRTGQSGGGWPGTFDDVEAAVRAVPDLIVAALEARGQIVPDLHAPVLAGHSAGGHLALWSASRVPVVRGVLALAPVADLVLAHRLGLGADAVADLLGGGPVERPERYAAADPVQLLPLGVPTIVVHGDKDQLVPVLVGREFVAAAQRSGDDASLVEIPGIEHFALIEPGSSAWSAVLGALAAFGT